MLTLYSLLWHLLSFYMYLIIADVIFNWLYSLRIINVHNHFVTVLGDVLYRFSEPSLSLARRICPKFYGLDLSPAIVLFFIYLIQGLMQEYLLPIVMHR